MPTVVTIKKIRVVIYTNDHPQPHVHALKPGGGRAKFELNCSDGPVRLLEQVGLARGEIDEIGVGIAKSLAGICGEWSRIHG